jgi:hypothetical protein
MEDSRQDLRTEDEKRSEDGGMRMEEEGQRAAGGGFGLPTALRLAQAGRIWPCISRDVMRVPRIVKPARGQAAVIGRTWHPWVPRHIILGMLSGARFRQQASSALTRMCPAAAC